jgi:EpsI family protein
MTLDLRFLSVALLLAVTAVLFRLRPAYEDLPTRTPFLSFPLQLGQWRGMDEPILPEVLRTLGKGDFLLRAYQQDRARPSVELFMAYVPSQQEGDTIHSPQNCLPGSGWSPISSNRTFLTLHGHRPFLVNLYVIGKGEDREVVIYWYLAHGRAVASEYRAKFYLVADSIRLNRSDGALIRISSQLK